MDISASKVGSGEFNRETALHPSFFKLNYGFAIAIILGMGGVAVAGIGLAGYLQVGVLSRLSQIHSIMMMTAGGGILVVATILGLVKNDLEKSQRKKNLNLEQPEQLQEIESTASYLTIVNSTSFSQILASNASENSNEAIIVDTKARHELREKAWYLRIFHTFAIRKEDRIFFEHLKNFIKEQHHISDDLLFNKVWGKSLANKKIDWNSHKPLNLKTAKAINDAIQTSLLYHGKGVRPVDAPENDAKAIARALLYSSEIKISNLFNLKYLSAVLIKKDPELLKEFQEEFQQALLQSFQIFQSNGLNEIHFETFIGNILSLLPFTYPQKGDAFQIPQKIDDIWTMGNYVVDEVISLTPSWFSSPLPTLGLVSTENTKPPPLLLCLGTTYPAGDGYVASLLSDFTPGLSIGHAPYLLGKNKIKKWLEKKNGVRVYGTSLGGATALHIGRNHGNQIEKVYAFNPPGLYAWNWCGENHKPEFHIYKQKNDLVSSIGAFPTGDHVHLYEILSGPQGNGKNPIAAHCKVYAGDETVTILKGDAQQHNWEVSTIVLSGMHFILGSILLFIPIFLINSAKRLIELLVKFMLLPLTVYRQKKQELPISTKDIESQTAISV